MDVTINGEREVYDGPMMVADLVARRTGRERPLGVAVARNGAVVPRSRWGDTEVEPGDEIELVGVMQGG